MKNYYIRCKLDGKYSRYQDSDSCYYLVTDIDNATKFPEERAKKLLEVFNFLGSFELVPID